jgi:hypothetical protein
MKRALIILGLLILVEVFLFPQTTDWEAECDFKVSIPNQSMYEIYKKAREWFVANYRVGGGDPYQAVIEGYPILAIPVKSNLKNRYKWESRLYFEAFDNRFILYLSSPVRFKDGKYVSFVKDLSEEEEKQLYQDTEAEKKRIVEALTTFIKTGQHSIHVF